MEDGNPPQRAKVKGMADLRVRLISGLAMVAGSAAALWLGGWMWLGFVVLLAGLVLWEWNRLVSRFAPTAGPQTVWRVCGALYVGAAAIALIGVRNGPQLLPVGGETFGYTPLEVLLAFIAPVIAVDVGAYFAGRAIGGPKIAPAISPSKTWAGLIGGAVLAGGVVLAVMLSDFGPAEATADAIPVEAAAAAGVGVVIAVLAQAGDFFESWMKRRAGVKDSSGLIPGHGGLFDRLDGFIAVYFVWFVAALLPSYVW
jgi:phosphatidate cytidylyltransferase